MPVRIETKNPHVVLVLLSLAIMILAIVAHFMRIPTVTQYHFWVAVIGYAVLLWATVF
jgi:hypothetical protein